MSVKEGVFGRYVTSGLVKTQNKEPSFKCIAYNMHRQTDHVVNAMISTWPKYGKK
jgi:hypothetical protein